MVRTATTLVGFRAFCTFLAGAAAAFLAGATALMPCLPTFLGAILFFW